MEDYDVPVKCSCTGVLSLNDTECSSSIALIWFEDYWLCRVCSMVVYDVLYHCAIIYHTSHKFCEVTLAVIVQLAYILIDHVVLVQAVEHLIRSACSALL